MSAYGSRQLSRLLGGDHGVDQAASFHASPLVVGSVAGGRVLSAPAGALAADLGALDERSSTEKVNAVEGATEILARARQGG